MRALLLTARKAAASDATVLLTGESGTGKEVIAQQIHRWSPRAQEPMVAVDCSALAENLLESELFGHERGAFTGADRRRPGRFELAHRGTLFLDEIGELAPALQVKLLRALQERTFERVGGREPIAVDVRVIAATNRDLAAAVRDGRFREDLFYRLDVIRLQLPPLRERRDDVVPLARAFLQSLARRQGRVLELLPAAEQRLAAYGWPGNVRELRNAIERAAVLCEGGAITADDLPQEVIATAPPATGFHAEVEACRRRLLLEALQKCSGNRTRAAELLGLQRTYLVRLLRQYGLGEPGPGGGA
jgi:transcriptional regulator with PAS, ATPase and Fis domain